MSIEPGQTLSHYRLLSKIGAGGMGEVWKAVDTTLDREVAIKILPDVFAADTERLERFEREAKLLASLNHTGIAVVHGLHEQDGRRFLAMELVPGDDLARRLEAGPLELEQALFVGVQVAEALEAAHAQGVIHRDLKPANIILTPDGRAKVLDFGLAKMAGPSGSGSASLSPTLTSGGTAAGMILGTAAYMSPEQARGRELDRRTDIWSFGCVLFECLTGQRIYKGESISDSLGAILHKEPDWSLLPARTPPTVRLLLRRCLTKDADKRLHDIADARIELEHAIEDPDSSSAGLAVSIPADAGVGPRRAAAPWAVAVAAGLALVAGLAGGWLGRGTPREAPVRKLDLGVRIERGGNAAVEMALSPDGRHAVFSHKGRLWVQALDAFEPRELEGTDGALAPFWSPDGQEIGYMLGRKLWKTHVFGGSAVAIGDLAGEITGGRGASWGEDGRIIVSRGNSGLLAISALGGAATEVVPLAEGESDLHEPHVLPGGKGILMVIHPESKPPAVLALFAQGERKVLLDAGGGRIHSPVYAHSGHIVFRRTGGDTTEGLWALPFSLSGLEVMGEPFLVVPDAASGSVSADGTLAFVHRPPAAGKYRMTWIDRSGRPLETLGGDRNNPRDPSLSPDGRRLAFAMQDEEGDNYDLWVRDLERETETRLTVDAQYEFGPRWTRSGDEVLYGRFDPVEGKVSVRVIPADGSGQPRTIGEGIVASCLTPDGLSFVAMVPPEGGQLGLTGDSNLALMSLDGSGEPRMLIDGPDREGGARVSPDGRWMAYQSERAERKQIYLTRFPEAKGRWQVSVGQGQDAHWDPRGDRLYFRDGMKLMEVTVGEGDEPRLGKATQVLDLTQLGEWRGIDVAADGESFLLVQRAGDDREEEENSGIKIVQNWIREFRP